LAQYELHTTNSKLILPTCHKATFQVSIPKAQAKSVLIKAPNETNSVQKDKRSSRKEHSLIGEECKEKKQ
jgi:hypothetical protein